MKSVISRFSSAAVESSVSAARGGVLATVDVRLGGRAGTEIQQQQQQPDSGTFGWTNPESRRRRLRRRRRRPEAKLQQLHPPPPPREASHAVSVALISSEATRHRISAANRSSGISPGPTHSGVPPPSGPDLHAQVDPALRPMFIRQAIRFRPKATFRLFRRSTGRFGGRTIKY